MPRRVRRAAGLWGAELPEGWVLDPGDVVVISTAEWTQIVADGLDQYLDDLGSTTAPITRIVSERDEQQVIRYIRDGGLPPSTGGDGDLGGIGAYGAIYVGDVPADPVYPYLRYVLTPDGTQVQSVVLGVES